MKKCGFIDFLYDFSVLFLWSIFSLFIFDCIFFMFGCSLSNISLLFSLIVFILLNFFKYKNNLKFFTYSILLFIFICIFSYLISITFIDLSGDGRAYHQATIFFLKQGWNPYGIPVMEYATPLFQKLYYEPSLWVQVYTKFVELIAANVYLFTDKIESGKVINCFFSFITFCFSLKILKKNLKSNLLLVCYSFLIVWTPITICQFFTYYNDIIVYYVFVILLYSVYQIEYSKDKNENEEIFDFSIPIIQNSVIPYINFAILLIILCNIKYNGIILSLVCVFVYLLYLVFLDRRILKKFLVSIFVSAIVLAIINIPYPFYKNYYYYGHPLHPYAGKLKMKYLETHMIPDFLKSKSIPEIFFISHFGKTYTKDYFYDDEYKILKIPFDVRNNEKFILPDVRIGAYGYFWSGILIFLILLIPFLRFNTKTDKKVFCLSSIIIILTILANPACWYPRLIPQIWFLVVSFLYFLFVGSDRKIIKYFCFVILFLLYINNFIIAYQNITHSYLGTIGLQQFLSDLKKEKQPIKIYKRWYNAEGSYFVKLDERDIKWELVDKKYFEKNKEKFVLIPNMLQDSIYYEKYDKI